MPYYGPRFGELVIQEPLPGVFPRWELVELVERVDTYATIVVTVVDENYQPLQDVDVCWYWPDAPYNSGAAPLAGLPQGMRPDRSAVGDTNSNGDVGFAMGKGAAYLPPDGGPHAIWIMGQNSVLIWKLGWLAGTNHDHLDVVIRRVSSGGNGEEPTMDTNAELYNEDATPMSVSDCLRMYSAQASSYGGNDEDERFVLEQLWAAHGDHRTFAPRVLDADRNPVPNVSVSIFNANTNKTRTEKTDGQGYAKFFLLEDTDEYYVPAQVGIIHCAVVGQKSEVYDTGGIVHVKKKDGPPRWLNPVFVWNTGGTEEEPGDDVDQLIIALEELLNSLKGDVQQAQETFYDLVEAIG